jgi:hypothetical protein
VVQHGDLRQWRKAGGAPQPAQEQALTGCYVPFTDTGSAVVKIPADPRSSRFFVIARLFKFSGM